VHLAAKNPEEGNPLKETEEKDLFYATNTDATTRIAQLVKKYGKRMIYVSTVAVYDLSTRTDGDLGEEEQLPGRDATKVYALSKFLGEQPVLDLPNSVILRLTNTYGADGSNETIIPTAIKTLLSNEPYCASFGAYEFVSFIHVQDVAQTIDVLIHMPDWSGLPRIINVANPERTTVLTFADCLARICREKGMRPTISIDDTQQTKNYRFFKTDLMQQHLGIKPISLYEGLKLRFNELSTAQK